MLIMAFVQGYTVFLPGKWNIATFLFYYAMIGVFPILFVVWKVVYKTHVSLCIPLSEFYSMWVSVEKTT